MRAVVLGVAGLLVLAVPAAADQTIHAARGKRFATTDVTIAQGERLTLINDDSVQHDVTATKDFGGKPLFASPLVDPKGQATVDGTQYLTTGDYAFQCSIHPDMEGTLHVSSAGSPVPRDGAASLKARSASLAGVRRTGRLRVTLAGPAGTGAIVAAKATLRGRRLTLAKSRVTLDPGRTPVTLKLTSSARRALKGVGKLTVTFKATVLAASGASAVSTKHTYR